MMNPTNTPGTGAPDSLKEALEMGNDPQAAAPVGDVLEVDTFESTGPEVTPNRSSEPESVPASDEVDSVADMAADMSGLATANPNVTQTEAYSVPNPKIIRTPLADALTLPTVPSIELNRLIDAIPNTDELGNTDAGRKWLMQIAEQQALLLHGNSFDNSQNQEGSEWVQRPSWDNERYGIAAPRFGDEKEAGLLTGDRAAAILSSVMKLGATLRIPLWHTGIYLTIKSPGDAEQLELQRLIDTEKSALGRMTHGMLFSNSSVITNTHLIDFILRHVYTASVSFESPADLKKLIDLDDLPTMIWGTLCTIFPSGHPYSRPCVKGPSVCTHVVEENLALTKIHYVNQRRLTESRRKHMKARAHKVTVEDIRRYKEDDAITVRNEIVLNDHVRVYLRSPTLAEYEETGHAWIRSLQDAADSAFSGRLNSEETNRYIVDAAKTQAIMNYAHYIDRIVIRNDQADGDNVITDRDALAKSLMALSADQDVYTAIITAVGKYIDDRAMAFVAIPRYTCPACEHDQGVVPERVLESGVVVPAQEISSSKHPYLIPIDVTSLFFITTGRRIMRALTSRAFQ